MSLDVRLIHGGPAPSGSGIFIREDGQKEC